MADKADLAVPPADHRFPRWDRIRIQRGELPLEVQDLEDEVGVWRPRLNKLEGELADLEGQVSDKQNSDQGRQGPIKKYEGQQAKVQQPGVRLPDQEIEFQNLRPARREAHEEFKAQIEAKKELKTRAAPGTRSAPRTSN